MAVSIDSSSRNIQISVDDHSDEIRKAFEDSIKVALNEVGLVAVRYAARLCHVDTGRLRASISYTTKESQGRMYEYQDNSGKPFSYKIGGGAKENNVYVGTNVEYAPYVEKRFPYLKPAVTNHIDEYRELIHKRVVRP